MHHFRCLHMHSMYMPLDLITLFSLRTEKKNLKQHAAWALLAAASALAMFSSCFCYIINTFVQYFSAVTFLLHSSIIGQWVSKCYNYCGCTQVAIWNYFTNFERTGSTLSSGCRQGMFEQHSEYWFYNICIDHNFIAFLRIVFSSHLVSLSFWLFVVHFIFPW